VKNFSVIIIIENTSERVADDNNGNSQTDWFLWTIALKAIPTSFVESIESVTYYLHPTFAKNVVKSENKENNFLLVSRGWGEFNVRMEIILKDQRRTMINHWLSLRDENGINKNQTKIKLYDDDFKKPRMNLTR
jgi:transcription initiation factor IIF auxiliary subunit